MKREDVETYGLAALGAVEGVAENYVGDFVRRLSPAEKFLAATATGVVVFNFKHRNDGNTITEDVHKKVEARPFVVRAVIASLALHEMYSGSRFQKVDFWHHGFNLLKKV